MNNHIGLAFSPERITYARFVLLNSDPELKLNQTGGIEYTFPYEPFKFFNEVNVPNVGNLLRQTFDPIENNQSTFSVTIESNLATLKRVIFPKDFDEKEQGLHITWEINESLPGSIEEYVYLRTDNRLEKESIIEELVIIVPKKVVSFIHAVADYAQIKLTNLTLNTLAAEVAFKKLLANDMAEVLALCKLTSNLIETTILHRGEFFTSFYEPLATNENRNNDDIILERLKIRIKTVENLFEQYKFEHSSVGHIYIYGDPIEDKLLEKIRKNTSIQVDRFNPIDNIAKTDDYNTSGNQDVLQANLVECIGVALDQ
jgi:Tfp pilus assembly PilM family ATPase